MLDESIESALHQDRKLGQGTTVKQSFGKGWDLWIRMADVAEIHCEEGFTGLVYRRWSGSLTRNPNFARADVALRIVRDAVARRYPTPAPPKWVDETRRETSYRTEPSANVWHHRFHLFESSPTRPAPCS